MSQLEEIKERFEENSYIESIDWYNPLSRVQLLAITAKNGDLPFTLMDALRQEYNRVHLYNVGVFDGSPVLILGEGDRPSVDVSVVAADQGGAKIKVTSDRRESVHYIALGRSQEVKI